MSIIVSHIIANRIQDGAKYRKSLLVLGIVINIGILALIKYSDFIIENINRVINYYQSNVKLSYLEIESPLGISFYTFTVVGYLIDVYCGKNIGGCQKNITKTGLFVSFFPLMTSGPIVRYEEMESGLFCCHIFEWKNITYGVLRILWGLFKKLVIASRAGVLVDTIYSNTNIYDGFYIWIAAFLFLFQLYADFSGCMDIVIGVAECFDIRLPENFRTPFFSYSVQEYWQRWHITLGAWMRDYVMYPFLNSKLTTSIADSLRKKIGKKASRQITAYFGMLIVWLLIGLWHGGKWKFIFGFGLWFFMCIVLEHVSEPFFNRIHKMLCINTDCFSWHLFQSMRVFFLSAIGNMFFRLEGLKKTIRVMHKAVSSWNPEIFFDDSLYSLGLDPKNFRLLLCSIIILLFISAFHEIKGDVRDWVEKQNMVFKCGVYIGLFYLVFIFGIYGSGYNTQAFIYEAF